MTGSGLSVGDLIMIMKVILFHLFTLSKIVLYARLSDKIFLILLVLPNTDVAMPRKTIYGRCPKCKTKSELEVLSGTPGKEKFRCNQCYHNFGMEEL